MNQADDKMKLWPRIGAHLIVVLAAILLTSCLEPKPIQRVSKYFPCKTVDTIQTAGKSRSSDQKMIVTLFNFGDGSAKVRETRVTFGKGNTPISDGCDFFFVLVGTENEMLARYGIWDPNVQIADDVPAKGIVTVRETYFSARFPFSPKAREIQVLDENNKLLTRADLIPAIRDFCQSQKADKDCQSLKLNP